jgi:hypothetical protein
MAYLRHTLGGGVIDVTVKVPEDRVGEFYALVGRWLAGEPLASEVADAPVTRNKNWTDSEEDLPLARQVWGKLSPPARAMFSTLIDEPERRVSGQDLASVLEIPNGKNGVAGVLAWPARYCAAVNRDLPWCWEYSPDGSGAHYWFEREVADLFRKVRD